MAKTVLEKLSEKIKPKTVRMETVRILMAGNHMTYKVKAEGSSIIANTECFRYDFIAAVHGRLSLPQK